MHSPNGSFGITSFAGMYQRFTHVRAIVNVFPGATHQ